MRWVDRDQRGVTAVMVAVLVSAVLVVSAAFAVDLGQQRVVRRDMQAIADVVALDLARHLDGRTKSALMSSGDIENAKVLSVQRNDATYGDAPDLTWELGQLNGSGVFESIASGAVPTAVKVTAESGVGFAFGGVTGVAQGDANRIAVATADENACFRIGSFIASLDSSQSALLNPILNSLLGSSINLNAVSYQGLANANVSLLDLVNLGGLGVGTVEELLELDNLSAGELFIATAKVLDSQGKLAEANLLRSINVAAGTPRIAIGDLLDAGATPSAALGTSLNVLDIVTGAAFIANEGHAVNIPNLGITLPGVATTTTSLTVIEFPPPKCGRKGTTTETAQIRLRVTATIPARQQNVSILGLAAVNVTLDPTTIILDLDLGKAIAELTKVTCNASGPESVTISLASSVVGSVQVSASTGVHASITVPLLGSGGLLGQLLSVLGLSSLLSPPRIDLNATLATSATAPPASTYTKTITIPVPGGYSTPFGSGSGVILGPVSSNTTGTTNMTITYQPLLGGPQTKAVLSADALYSTVLNPILSSLTGALSPIITQLQAALIGPLTELLGVQLGGADVFALPTPSCGDVKLVG